MRLQRSDFAVDFKPIEVTWTPLTETKTIKVNYYHSEEWAPRTHEVALRIAHSGALSAFQVFNRKAFPKLYGHNGEPLFRSVLTIAALVDKENAFCSFSFCSQKEHFNLKRGVTVAFCRLADYMISGQPGGFNHCRHEGCVKERAAVVTKVGIALYRMSDEALLHGVYVSQFHNLITRVSE